MSNPYGLRCPQCGDEDNIGLEVRSWGYVYQYGVDVEGYAEWEDDFHASCSACGKLGTVAEFDVNKQPKDAAKQGELPLDENHAGYAV